MEKTVKTVVLALGSNLGNRSETISEAINRIQNEIGNVTATADLIETDPYEMESLNTFLNTCILVQTSILPFELLKKLQEIEIDLGRPQNSKGKKIARTIDLDIIFYDNEVITNELLTIPHKEYHLRDFVLKPLLQIAPYFIDPVKNLTVKQLIN
jgi:2-amino-4-hydroxy-6-hydroxymethyldihydropteridine diphosphokinase